MEFVGRTVKKEFEGFGAFSGVVKSYDASSGFFEIVYDDGDSEELEFSELTALVDAYGVGTDQSSSPLGNRSSRVGRGPKRRRSVLVSSISGNENGFSSSIANVGLADECNLDSVEGELRKKECCSSVVVDDLSKKLDFSSSNNNCVSICSDNLNSSDGNGMEENDLESKGNGNGTVGYPIKKQKYLDLNTDVDLGGYPKKENSSEDHESLGKTHTGGGKGGKKRKVEDSPKTESVLRRSSRRRAKLSDNDRDDEVNDDGACALPSGSSPVTSAVSEEQPTVYECKESEEPCIVPPKLELPSSTGNLNLDDLPVLDLFSVYAFLRSFSTILFLSPFELGDFVASLRSKSPNLLIDSIHVSLLRMLRKLLEFQSSESSISATNCLRDLNWDLLDLITWPMFMAEYLLMKPGFDLAQLKLFKTDYHKQPGSVKVKMLQYICDAVIEVEAISSEVNRRILVGDPTNLMDPDLNAKLTASKRRKEAVAISGSSCMSEEVIDETADWNSDECCLCKMDGNLICCDGCPAAYHSKCVGIATSLLPEGDWYCPECVVDKKNLDINVAKSIRGADFLGVDAHGRSYYSSCSYILVSDLHDEETSYRYYHMSDLTVLIDALHVLNGPYRDVSNAITKHWHLYNKLYGEKRNLDLEKPGGERPLAARKGKTHQLENGYLNFYSFARVASSVAREWTQKPSDNKTSSQAPTKSLEELISIQMKLITKISGDFCWSNIQNLSVDAQKEKCGWCLACKFPTDDGICLFYMNSTGVLENYTSQLLGFGSRISRNDRLIDVMCHILHIEDRLHGLLLGPWLNPHFPKLYRDSFLEASDIARVKDLLLMLESNIWSRAFSDEWIKHVDSVSTVGSASHVVTSKIRMLSTRNVVGKKRSKSSDPEPHSSKNLSSGLSLFWWRGGRLTRRLFNWKVLPRSLACKAARQGGGKKIDGILYPENYEFPKRSKAHVWRAFVQSAVTVEQLALQIRELDANIKWDEIENNSHLAKLDKGSLKTMRSFKKAIIRRKSSEGGCVKYLLDFGKRRFIPDMVVKHGSKIDDSSSSERKKYWVEESYVPLFLLKPFEEKRIALKSNKSRSNSLPLSTRVVKSPAKKDVFSYLFSKAEKSQCHVCGPCGHCNKDVLARDAVSCEQCEGFFHKSHAKKRSGGVYICHKCHAGDTVKAAGSKKGKLGSRKTKKVNNKKKKGGKQPQAKTQDFVVPLRRSSRTIKVVSLHSKTKTKAVKKKKKQSKKSGGSKLKSISEIDKPKGKRGRPRKMIKPIYQKKRSPAPNSIYWLNGLLISRKPNDERVTKFRSKNHIQGSDFIPEEPPKCSICQEPEFKSTLNYISCDSCKDWFHGDAFGLNDEKVGVIISFKCHKCRERPQPVCMHYGSKEDPSESGPDPKEGPLQSGPDSKEDPAPSRLDCKEDCEESMPDIKDEGEENGPDFKEDPAQSGPDSNEEPAQSGPDSKEDPVPSGLDCTEDCEESMPDIKDEGEENGSDSKGDLVQSGPDSKEEPVQSAPDSKEDPVESAPDSKEEPAQSGADCKEDLERNGPDSKEPAQSGPDSKEEPVQSAPDSKEEPVQSAPDSKEEPARNGPDPKEDPAQSGPDPREYPAQSEPDSKIDSAPSGLDCKEDCSESMPDIKDGGEENGPDSKEDPAQSGPDPKEDPEQNGPDSKEDPEQNGPDSKNDLARNGLECKEDWVESMPDIEDGGEENGPDSKEEPVQSVPDPKEDPAQNRPDSREDLAESMPDPNEDPAQNRPDSSEDLAESMLDPKKDPAQSGLDRKEDRAESMPDIKDGGDDNGPDFERKTKAG